MAIEPFDIPGYWTDHALPECVQVIYLRTTNLEGMRSRAWLSVYITCYAPKLSRHRLMHLFMMSSNRKSPTSPINALQDVPSTRIPEKTRGPCNKRVRIKKKTKEQLKNENFRRQNKSLTKRGNKLTKFEADVYIQVRRKGKITIYTSLEDPLEDPSWPLRPEDVVRRPTNSPAAWLTKLRPSAIRFLLLRPLRVSK